MKKLGANMKKYNTHDYEGLLAETIKIKSEKVFKENSLYIID